LKKFCDIFDVEVEKISGSKLVKELNEKLEIKIVRICGKKIWRKKRKTYKMPTEIRERY
jgi:hypothetical protein